MVNMMICIILSDFCMLLNRPKSLSIFSWSIWFAFWTILDMMEEPDSERYSLPFPSCESPIEAFYYPALSILPSILTALLSSPPFLLLVMSYSICLYLFSVAPRSAFSLLSCCMVLWAEFCSCLQDFSSSWAYSTSYLISVKNRSWYSEWISPMLLSEAAMPLLVRSAALGPNDSMSDACGMVIWELPPVRGSIELTFC